MNKIMKTLCVSVCYYEAIVIPSPYTYTNILWLPQIQISKQFYPKKLEWRISNLSYPVYNRCWLAITWLDGLISSWLCNITAWLSSKWKQSAIFHGQCNLIRRNRQWCRTDGTLPSSNSLSKGTHHTGESTIRKGFPTAAESLDPRTITQMNDYPPFRRQHQWALLKTHGKISGMSLGLSLQPYTRLSLTSIFKLL